MKVRLAFIGGPSMKSNSSKDSIIAYRSNPICLAQTSYQKTSPKRQIIFLSLPRLKGCINILSKDYKRVRFVGALK
mgnify:CR=1 FL=1